MEEDPKEFVNRQEAIKPFRVGAALPELIVAEVESLGFEGIRVSQVGPHPVWSVTARLGTSIYDCEQILRVVFRRVARNLGFSVRMRDIIATIRAGRIQAVLCLDTPL